MEHIRKYNITVESIVTYGTEEWTFTMVSKGKLTPMEWSIGDDHME